jgi:hypothetical protein
MSLPRCHLQALCHIALSTTNGARANKFRPLHLSASSTSNHSSPISPSMEMSPAIFHRFRHIITSRPHFIHEMASLSLFKFMTLSSSPKTTLITPSPTHNHQRRPPSKVPVTTLSTCFLNGSVSIKTKSAPTNVKDRACASSEKVFMSGRTAPPIPGL